MDKTEEILDLLVDIASTDEVPRNLRSSLESISDLLVDIADSVESRKHKISELIELMINDQNTDMALKTNLLSLLSIVESIKTTDS